MNNRTKILSVILVIAMVTSVFGIIPAGAEEIKVHTAPSGASVDERYPDFEYESEWWYDGVIITAYTGSAKEVVIPETLGGYTVVAIEEDAFAYSPSVKTVTVPDTVYDMYWNCMGYLLDGYDSWDYTKADDFTIVGGLFSEAMFYAKDNGFNFVSINEPESIVLDETKYVNDDSVLKFTAEKDMNILIDYYKDNYVYCTLYNSDYREIAYGNKYNHLCAHVIAGETYYIKFETDYEAVSIQFDITVSETGDYDYAPFDDGITASILKYIDKVPESLTIPEIIENYTVTALAYYSFQNQTNLKSVTLPKTLKEIGGRSFSKTSLEKIDIPNGVEEIGVYAFYNCSTLDEVNVPYSVKSIGQYAFSGTKWYNDQPDGAIYLGKVLYEYKGENPNEIEIREGTKSITSSAFSKRSTTDEVLKKVTIPDTVTETGTGVFADCSALEEVKLSESLSEVSDRMFMDCTSLKSIELPYGIEDIGYSAFYGCTDLQNVSIPDTVKNIGWYAFYDCPNLKSVTIPRSVQYIDDNALGYLKYGEKNDDFVIYGYKNTAAELYAIENDIEFIAIEDKTDEKTDLRFSVPEDVTMSVDNMDTDKGTVAKAAENLSEGSKLISAYDISYFKDSEKAQPGAPVTVKIPCPAPDCKVYYVDENGNLTDMNAHYEDDFLVYDADHFSIYIVAQIGYMLGDVDGNTEVEAIDATFVQRHSIDLYIPISVKKLLNGDIDNDSEISIVDATFIQRFTTSIYTPFPIGEYITRQ